MIAALFSDLGFFLVLAGCALMFVACLLFVCVCIDHWRRERHYARLAQAEDERAERARREGRAA